MLPLLTALSDFLAATPASNFIQVTTWIIPTAQTVHILAIAVVLSSVGMINLRILGWAGARASITETARRYVPWIWGGLAVLLTTGSVLILGEPERALTNPAFHWKMALLATMVVATVAFRTTVVRRAPIWDRASQHRGAKLFAVVALLIWLTIAVLGRMIAYVGAE